MKHSFKTILILVLFFLVAQLIGLVIVQLLTEKELAFGIQRPQLNKETSFISIFLIILLVTGITLLIARFNAIRLWKVWFFASIVLVLTISLSAFVHQYIALFFALIGAYFKVVKFNLIVHDFTELFIYGGLAALFVPVFSILSISILLLLIAGYDAVAVWKTKHMIRLAKFQNKVKLFAGLLIPSGKKRMAILGGGDIGFPLLFTGVVINESGSRGLIIPFIVAISLFLLLYFGKEDRYYPAMPFLAAGCFIGYFLTFFI